MAKREVQLKVEAEEAERLAALKAAAEVGGGCTSGIEGREGKEDQGTEVSNACACAWTCNLAR